MAVPFGDSAVSSQNLDHLGLVTGMYDELGIGEVLDRTITQDTDQRHVTIGQDVKALVVNGLGFINRALYLTPQFFMDKPTERLIGPGIRAEHLNDDVLGRALDTLYEHDVTTLFMLISAPACQRLGLSGSTVHVDSTSFHVDGDYDHEEARGVVTLTHGYRRDRRPDLNQVMLNLIVEHRAGLPLWMQPLSGNSHDTASFGRRIEAPIEQLNTTPQVDYWVADSALYRAANGQLLSAHRARWITRVPETLSLAQQYCAAVGEPTALLPGYGYRRVEVNYGGVRQRWLIITSIHALQRAVPSVDRQLGAASEHEFKEWHRLHRQRFACETDAHQALLDFQATRKVLSLMIMTLCLLVYAALEYRLRQALANTRTAVPDQPGKPTQRPTMRWVFQILVGIHVLLIAGQTAMILNFTPPQQDVIRLLEPPYQALYS